MDSVAPKNNEQEDKHDMSELPLDLLAELLCPAYKEGTVFKYYRNSWRLGFKLSVQMSALLRHISAFYYYREDYDQDTLKHFNHKKHHIGAAIFCLICMYNSLQIDPERFDDRPYRKIITVPIEKKVDKVFRISYFISEIWKKLTGIFVITTKK